MGYRNLLQCVLDLERAGHLVRIKAPIDACLEAAEIQRRLYLAQGPALLFENVVGCRFPMVCNLFGTRERTHFMFRDTFEAVRKLVELKVDPNHFFRRPLRYAGVPFTALHMLPRRVGSGSVLRHETTISQLPQLKSWPADGGGFVTLPEVYSEDVEKPGLMASNLGMYRVQLTGNEYEPDREIGLHYQIHRSIGVHHAKAIAKGVPFKVNIFVGGSPAMILGAVMPLPEGMSELTFAGALAGHRIPMITRPDGPAIYAEADFCITGTIDPERLKPEGPFGDHLGYYSLAHDFPVLKVEKVYHRAGAIWPFTVVGRPPQEDTSFGDIIHEITGPIIPTVLPGVKAVHAVDAAGVHPLLLAIGSERYTPYHPTRRPQELLTNAHAILGQGQLSLAKYLLIVAQEDNPQLDIHDIAAFFRHLLERVDWRRDLHFETSTTIDTLDYSGMGLNEGSKVVIAAAGPAIRTLPTQISCGWKLPEGMSDPRVCLPGVLAITASKQGSGRRNFEIEGEKDSFAKLPQHFSISKFRKPDPILELLTSLPDDHPLNQWPLIVLCDDSEFAARSLNNFLWVTFTRSNPATDIDGIGAMTEHKHWGCRGSLIIDARRKPHHAPPLIEEPAITKRVDELAAPGGPLHGLV